MNEPHKASPAAFAAAARTSPSPINNDDQLRRSLAGSFTLIEPLGLHGSYLSFLARDEREQPAGFNSIVLKVLTKEAASDPAEVDLFYREARAAGRLSHKNIVKGFEAFEIDGIHLCVNEQRPKAETLRDVLERNAWLQISKAISITYQVVSALEHAHRNAVVHLNLRPENIVLEPDGTALLTNFGLELNEELKWAHLRRSARLASAYLSPEQCTGRPLDSGTDLYATGVILFEMLTDRTPFSGGDELVRQKQISQTPQSPKVFRPAVPDLLADLVIKLIEKNPAKRLQKASEVLTALDEMICTRPLMDMVEPELSEESNCLPDLSSALPYSVAVDTSVNNPSQLTAASDPGDSVIRPNLASTIAEAKKIPIDEPDEIDLVADTDVLIPASSSEANLIDMLQVSVIEPAVEWQPSQGAIEEVTADPDAVDTGRASGQERLKFEAPAIEVVSPKPDESTARLTDLVSHSGNEQRSAPTVQFESHRAAPTTMPEVTVRVLTGTDLHHSASPLRLGRYLLIALIMGLVCLIIFGDADSLTSKIGKSRSASAVEAPNTTGNETNQAEQPIVPPPSNQTELAAVPGSRGTQVAGQRSNSTKPRRRWKRRRKRSSVDRYNTRPHVRRPYR